MEGPDPEEFVDCQDSADFSNIVTHMYRGEVQRTYNWRGRLDRTTEWSIVLLSAITTWVFSVPERSHFLLLAVLIFMGVLLRIEARRYRYYNMWQGRVKTLEENFMARTLCPDEEVSSREWMKILAEDLKSPKFKIPIWVAIAHRLRRVYFWLFSITIILWLVKLIVHPYPTSSIGNILQRASIIEIPGWIVISLIVLFILVVSLVALIGKKYERKGEKVVEKDEVREDWDEKMT